MLFWKTNLQGNLNEDRVSNIQMKQTGEIEHNSGLPSTSIKKVLVPAQW